MWKPIITFAATVHNKIITSSCWLTCVFKHKQLWLSGKHQFLWCEAVAHHTAICMHLWNGAEAVLFVLRFIFQSQTYITSVVWNQCVTSAPTMYCSHNFILYKYLYKWTCTNYSQQYFWHFLLTCTVVVCTVLPYSIDIVNYTSKSMVARLLYNH